MAEISDDFLAVMRQWIERQDARAISFREIRFGERGYFERAVAAVTPMLKEAIAIRPKEGHVGRSFVELLPEHFRSDDIEITNETVDQLVKRSAADFYSYQQLEYLALNPVFLQRLSSLKDWQQRSYLGLVTPPKRPKGQHKNANFFRDRAICEAIRMLKQAGFEFTRGSIQVDQSACDVVTAALRRCDHQPVKYDAVEKVWKNRNKQKPGAAGGELANAIADQLVAALGEMEQR